MVIPHVGVRSLPGLQGFSYATAKQWEKFSRCVYSSTFSRFVYSQVKLDVSIPTLQSTANGKYSVKKLKIYLICNYQLTIGIAERGIAGFCAVFQYIGASVASVAVGPCFARGGWVCINTAWKIE